jgi:hypothetical protein
VFETRALRRKFGPKREEVAGGWRRLHNEEHHNLYTSLSMRVTNSRKVRWTENVESMGEVRHAKTYVV